jgi:hypothetical protein
MLFAQFLAAQFVQFAQFAQFAQFTHFFAVYAIFNCLRSLCSLRHLRRSRGGVRLGRFTSLFFGNCEAGAAEEGKREVVSALRGMS